jgi:ABC-2 type transport system permease protein
VEATAVWLVLAALFVGVMVLLSACFASSAASAGIGIGVYIVLSLLALWGPALRYTPAGLGSLIGTFASASSATDAMWPIVTGVAAAAACFGLAIVAVRRLPL